MENLVTPNNTSPLAEWLYYLEHLHATAIDMGLERVGRVAADMHLLRPAPRVVTVAGTNGKGTTCRLLEAVLLAEGLKVGVYSSPHLLRYTERVRIQARELPEARHSEAMAAIETGRGDTSLSYFEFGTLAAFWLFKQAGLDVAILEVGLGGRLDATNIVDADVSVITSIALDHTELLGPDRESIGREKAGILRAGRPAVIGEPDRPSSIDSAALALGARLYCRDRDWRFSRDGDTWSWRDQQSALAGLPLPSIPLENAATALAALKRFPLAVSERAIRQGLAEASLPGRFQIIGQRPLRILDVAHNPHAAGYLAQRLAQEQIAGKVRAVAGMLADKDIAGTLGCLRGLVDEWYCATLDGPRAATAAQLAVHLDHARRFDDVASAWRQALLDADADDCVLVFGSFHTVAPIVAITDTEKERGE
ncbi:bifunctional tetrahydrofolate synthase/dihydrofolate synthase [Acerihabitans arboris]|uniref:Dihydrofolate synthase/folylpolyglutamate synthase n=1 Tax=Acerihabitans arboris TaxID=2691583 RepID=A0A845SQB9_9GAMM|nr:bifunctional tetrahydrofolate synthase/dihydrofolate synthase [Acerihabitans arboris]NDL65317.1 bifunctional tetrahydrofolate synthase/dihydrofolate synthase [Acerihabitans arboris]